MLFSQGKLDPFEKKMWLLHDLNSNFEFKNTAFISKLLSRNSTRGFLGYYLHRTALPATAGFEKAGHFYRQMDHAKSNILLTGL